MTEQFTNERTIRIYTKIGFANVQAVPCHVKTQIRFVSLGMKRNFHGCL